MATCGVVLDFNRYFRRQKSRMGSSKGAKLSPDRDLEHLVLCRDNDAFSGSGIIDNTGNCNLLGPEASVQDVFHAAVSLYDKCLPNTSTDDIYDAVSTSNTRTLLLYCDRKSAMEECKKVAERRSQKTNGHASTGLDNSGESDNGVEKEEKEDDSDSYDDEERSVLDCVYSDTSSEEESEEEESDSDDISEEQTLAGQKDYISAVKRRRKQRKSGQWDNTSMSVESRLAGAITVRTFEQGRSSVLDKGSQRVVQILLLAVRRRFRRRGYGQKLMQAAIRDREGMEAVVAYVDEYAMDFYKKMGFVNDQTLAAKYIDLMEPWTDCTLLCYIPDFFKRLDSSEVMKEIDEHIAESQIFHAMAHQKHARLLQQMKQRIQALQDEVLAQDKEIRKLTIENLDLKGKLSAVKDRS